jgi:predicted acylesterase/phospholipase RssA/CRP-like cAMP-binding protein
MPPLADAFAEEWGPAAARWTVSTLPDGVRGDARDLLGALPWFRELDDRELNEILGRTSWAMVRGNEDVLRAGESGDWLAVVMSGRLQVDPDGTGTNLLQVGRGGHVGELSSLTKEPRSATVRAVRDSQLILVPGDVVDDALRRHPDHAVDLARSVARLVQQKASRSDAVRTVALLAACEDDAASEACRHLAEALSAGSSVARIKGPQDLPTNTQPWIDGGDVDHRVVSWLNDQELAHEMVLYEARLDDAAWTQLTIRQADQIIVLATTGSSPPASVAALVPADRLRHAELLILHPSDWSLPTPAARWTAASGIEHVLHARLPKREDFERLARRLTGTAVGLVLGGGGARAYAHIGVIDALLQAGVPIDHIGGASLGGMIAAQYAFGYDVPGMIRLNEEGWVRRRPFRDYTLPLVSLYAGRRLVRAIEDGFGDAAIEDLRLPFFCVSTSLTTGHTVVHQTGSVAEAARAGLSIPGILPPVTTGAGAILVDGGLTNNLPVDVMRGLGLGLVIAVDVSPGADASLTSGFRETPSPWQLLWERRLPVGVRRRFPSIFRLMQRSALVSSSTRTVELRLEADLCLTPPVQQFDVFEWNRIRRLVDAGRAYTSTVIDVRAIGAAATERRPSIVRESSGVALG